MDSSIKEDKLKTLKICNYKILHAFMFVARHIIV